jgi:RNA polymerase sigma-70 factor (sigma-E family)
VMTQGPAEDFDAFVSSSLPALLRFAHVLTGRADLAEDLVSAALLRSWRAWGRVEEPTAFVRRVIVNQHLSWWRSRTRAVAFRADPVGPDEIARFDERDRVWRALATLPSRQRAVLVLRYYEDLSEAEIARVMGTSAGTVKSQASRGLRRLAELLDADAGDVLRGGSRG